MLHSVSYTAVLVINKDLNSSQLEVTGDVQRRASRKQEQEALNRVSYLNI